MASGRHSGYGKNHHSSHGKGPHPGHGGDRGTWPNKFGHVAAVIPGPPIFIKPPSHLDQTNLPSHETQQMWLLGFGRVAVRTSRAGRNKEG
ncbi:hypothetical protein Pyn_36871 [Prunus yedoensis var. nudiflora]|uniref:Uncharacterized protein n=1 Tax=Prunus yedoensis var. nudiflora TaxID=2094558 RepID=A0A314XUT2_PRUYE|nr:hypothetical protein Pyn_36871 [Prunus yedoensis var. nudiflora]